MNASNDRPSGLQRTRKEQEVLSLSFALDIPIFHDLTFIESNACGGISQGKFVLSLPRVNDAVSCTNRSLRETASTNLPWRSRRHGFRRFAKYSLRRVARSWMMITLNCSKSLGPFSRSFTASSCNLKRSMRFSLKGSG